MKILLQILFLMCICGCASAQQLSTGGWAVDGRPQTVVTNGTGSSTNYLYQNANLLPVPSEFQSPPGLAQTTNSWITNWIYRVTTTDLALFVRTTKASGTGNMPKQFNFSTSSGTAVVLPATNKFVVTVNGVPNPVRYVDYKRMMLYSFNERFDPYVVGEWGHIGVLNAVSDGDVVVVTDTDNTVMTNMPYAFSRTFSSNDFNSAIQVNQLGYYPTWDKRVNVGYYRGSNTLECVWPQGQQFNVWNLDGNSNQYTGVLSNAVDTGWSASTPPHQKVMYGDFTPVTLPGYYVVRIANEGQSLPFRIDPNYPQTISQYGAKGLYSQSCGIAVGPPYISLAHTICHSGVAYALTNTTTQAALYTQVNGMAQNISGGGSWNANQYMTNSANVTTGLWAWVRQTPVTMGSGYHDAGDYSEYTVSCSLVVSRLTTALDNYTGVSTLDALGVPESGDGIPDVAQLAKREADGLLWKQDSDGGVSMVAYPFPNYPYENMVPGDTTNRFLLPKDTLSSWAAAGALADLGSSPTFRKFYPDTATNYIKAAQNAWAWATQAVANAGYTNSWRPSHFYGEEFGPEDEMTYAGSALYIATSNSVYLTFVTNHVSTLFGSQTRKSWAWWPEWESYGSAQRSVAFSVKSGRVTPGFWNASFSGWFSSATNEEITVGAIVEDWSTNNAYGTPFQYNSKPNFTTPYYFGPMMVCPAIHKYELQKFYGQNPSSNVLNVVLRTLNFEAGQNPANKSRWAMMGANPIRSSPNQWDRNDDRLGPPTGWPRATLEQEVSGGTYGNEHLQIAWPKQDTDDQRQNLPPYERIGQDGFEVNNGEPISPNFAGEVGATAWLAGMATYYGPSPIFIIPNPIGYNTNQTVSIYVPGLNLATANIDWESRSNMLVQTPTYSWTPASHGTNWIRCEIQLPGGVIYSGITNVNVP